MKSTRSRSGCQLRWIRSTPYAPVHADFDAASSGGSASPTTSSRGAGGIHFRTACRDGRAPGTQVGSYVASNVAQSLRGRRKGQISHDHPPGEIGAEAPADDQWTK